MADKARLIKKYPNRRLYDTRTSSYITLADVKDWCWPARSFRFWMRRAGKI
jgi:polyhydroxyalkanoate synthesis regulator protein